MNAVILYLIYVSLVTIYSKVLKKPINHKVCVVVRFYAAQLNHPIYSLRMMIKSIIDQTHHKDLYPKGALT